MLFCQRYLGFYYSFLPVSLFLCFYPIIIQITLRKKVQLRILFYEQVKKISGYSYLVSSDSIFYSYLHIVIQRIKIPSEK